MAFSGSRCRGSVRSCARAYSPPTYACFCGGYSGEFRGERSLYHSTVRRIIVVERANDGYRHTWYTLQRRLAHEIVRSRAYRARGVGEARG